MARLTAAQRRALPDSDFALIQYKGGKKIRRYPIPDKSHQRMAISMRSVGKRVTDAQESMIKRKASKRLNRSAKRRK